VHSRTAVLGISALLLALAGCTSDDAVAPAVDQDLAQPSYVAPDEAPAFCEKLASSAELTELPTSIGTLVAGPDIEARTQISQTVQELRGVLTDVRDENGHEDVATALDSLITALGQVVDGGVTDSLRAAVSAGLEQVGAQAQPLCGFPT
jgi:hypothetical protein